MRGLAPAALVPFASALLTTLLMTLLMTGCDNTVTPFADDSDAVFALYGFLDTAEDTQFVRVSGLTSTTNDAQGVLPESVTLRSGRGDSVVLTDSAIVLDDGSPGHLFFAEMRPEAGATYTLEVSAVGGGAILARVTVPGVPPIATLPAQGDTLVLIQKIVIGGVRNPPHQLSIAYDVTEASSDDSKTVSISYGSGGRQTPAGWEFDVFLTRDRKSVESRLGHDPTISSLGLVATRIQMELLSQEWTTGSTNIQGGHGFFGAIGRYEVPWTLSSDELRLAGFADGAGTR